VAKNPGQVLVECAGVGYEVDVSMNTFWVLPEIGHEVQVWTHFVVREDVQLLFGFATEQERSAFRTLIKISGVGARTALSILSGISVDDLASAVVQQDMTRLIKVPGVGKKTAERLLLELKGKWVGVVSSSSSMVLVGVEQEISQALQTLGYADKEVSALLKKMPEGLSLSEGIRWALQQLA
jgi:Holliday junction DNA helicase RuvA